MTRRAGVLMPIFSLPSPCGIGTMGAAARKFVDFLAQAGQSCWQVLPLGPTGYGDSPYQSYSSFAGNPYFIDLDDLAAQGLLKRAEYKDLDWGADPGSVDYGLQYRQRFPILRLACARLQEREGAALAEFRKKEAPWLADYTLFMALKGKYNGLPWSQWPEPVRLRDRSALAAARRELAGEIAFWSGLQYLFFRQWTTLKSYANWRGISLIGDLPIYVSPDSADVWSAPEQFQLDKQGRPTEVAGCPPDYFSPNGQLWGNPLFNWDYMKKDHYRWWVRRVAFQFRLYDTLRIDHFRGFDEYYAIPAGDGTARNGRWRPGPGLDFFKTLERRLGRRDIIAEDLGLLTPGVQKLLSDTGYPGMKVLEFAFGKDFEDNAYLPHNYTENCVVYPGTHDNDTVAGWLSGLSPEEREYAEGYMRLTAREGHCWGVLRTAWSSPAALAVVQMQDLLGLGSEARVNTPSTTGRNWRWRALPGSFGGRLAARIRREMRLYQRLPKK